MQTAGSLPAVAAAPTRRAIPTFICLLVLLNEVVTCVDLVSSKIASPVPDAEWAALLDLKARITMPNTSHVPLLPAWNVENLHNVCHSWTGVMCTLSGNHIAAINLAGLGFTGSVSSHLGNLSFLSVLNLSSNHFFGDIPPELSSCSSLTALDFTDNSLTGPIPPSLASLSKLQALRLCSNHLSGCIPPPLFTNCTSLTELSLCLNALNGPIPTSWHLPQLQILDLASNNLSGHFPLSVGNCSNLVYLALHKNSYFGTIPSQLGSLSKLEELWLSYNLLSGHVPPSIGNGSSLLLLSVEHNSLSGTIPSQFCSESKLEKVSLSTNRLTGAIPSSLGSCKNLVVVDLSVNSLTGEIPTELGNLSNLASIAFWGNNLTGGIPRSLGNCRKLAQLDVSSNYLSGPIPSELGNLPTLSVLILGGNEQLNGTIPPALGNCTELFYLVLEQTQLSGSLPTQIMQLKHLQWLYLSGNRLVGFERPLSFGNTTSIIFMSMAQTLLSGPIPSELGQLHGLQYLDLSSNQLTGMPPWESLCNCTSLSSLYLQNNRLTGTLSGRLQRLSQLQHLDLSNNFLQGTIPQLGNLQLLKVDLSFNQLNGTLPDNLANSFSNVDTLDLSNNALSGDLPTWLGAMVEVINIDLSHNRFVGSIPESLAYCKGLTHLNLSGNNLVGGIPPALGSVLSLVSVDLSNNSLAGMLPSTLEYLPHLRFFNVSFNNLEGIIPASGAFRHLQASSFEGNPGLCGLLIRKPCKPAQNEAHKLGWKRNILIAALASLLGAAMVVTTCIVLYKYRNLKSQARDRNLRKLVEVRRFSAEGLAEATQGYSSRNVLGEGALGVVYKGVLPNDEVVAIKRFRDVTCARDALLQEVRILSKLRHRNLVRVLGCVLNLDVHALVLEFMPNGNLEQFFQQQNHHLSLLMILKIAQAVASALSYLHHEYDTTIAVIHGDVKPSNILLDSEFEARLVDFGLAKLAKSGENAISLSSNIKGSIGYMAPEFAYAAKITTKVDVYSFGVVVLEIVTGIGPTHEVLHGATLHEWVMNKLQDGVNVKEIVHASLTLDPSFSEIDELIVQLLLQMAMACTEGIPDKRPKMHNIKAFLDSQLASKQAIEV